MLFSARKISAGDLLKAVSLALAYFASARLGLSFATAPEQVTAIWPPTGVALAGLVLLGFRFWPAVTLGAFTANILAHEPIGVALLISAGNTLQGVASAYIFRRIADGNVSLNKITGLKGLLAGGTLGTLCSATIGTASLLFGGLIGSQQFASVWLLWWLGDTMGAIVFAPPILTCARSDFGNIQRAGLFENIFCVAMLIGLSYVTFSHHIYNPSQLKFIIFPVALWAAYRLDQRITSIALVLVLGLAIAGLLNGSGAFVAPTMNEKLLIAQGFMAVVAVTTLVIGSVATEQSETQASLRKNQEELEERIRERTAELKNSYDQLEARVKERTAELSTATEALRLNQEQLQAIIDNSSAIIQAKDPQGRFILVNREWESTTQLRRTEIIGKTLYDIYPKDAADKLAANDRLIIESGKAIQFEEEVPRASGTRTYITNKFPLIDHNGVAYAICGIATDITERKKAEDRERDARQQAEAANRAKDEFLAVVSHELRTPLSPILGWTRMMRAKKMEAADIQHALAVIERNVLLQGQLIEDLLDISRIITGKLRIDVKPMHLTPVLQAALDTVRPAAELKNIHVEVSMNASDDSVRGDADRLQQVAWNLLANAIKFTPRNGSISLDLANKESSLVLTVHDSGQGIPPEFLPKMFNRFSQADSTTTRLQGGLGLGLAIVRHIVELHGGTVSAESAGKNQGSTFRVTLPVSLIPVAGGEIEPRAPAKPGIAASKPALSGMRILVVDDERDNLEYIGLSLEHCGAEVQTATSVPEAFAKMQISHPDVVISDIGMPGEDGYSLIRRLRQENHGNGGKTLAIALTAYARAEDKQRILAAGFQLHIPKPIDPTDLANAVARLVKNAGAV